MKEFLKMMEAMHRRLENPHRSLLGPNYWIMQKVGLILPKSKKWRYAYIFLHELATVFVVSQYMELYLIRADMQDVLTNLKVSMLSTVCVIKSNTFAMWQGSWTQIMDYVTEADNFERGDKDDVKGKIIDRYTKYCRRLTHFYWCLVFITAVTVIVAPFMRYLSSSRYREDILNGTEPFPQIFSSWMPVDKYHSPGCWLAVLWHVCICGYGASVTAAYDTSIVVIMVFFGGHLELLRERCKQMMGSFGRGISEAEAEKVVREVHTIHTLLKKNSTLFNSVLSPVMFLYVVMCSLMLCASAFQLTIATSATQKLLMAEYLIACVAQLFIFCRHSNDVWLKSENVDLGPYESEWWAASVRQRKSVLILSGQLRNYFLFTAGPFTNLTLSTFLAILKGAYSYYTLLRK